MKLTLTENRALLDKDERNDPGAMLCDVTIDHVETGWRGDLPREWSGFDGRNRQALVLESDTWSSRALLSYANRRWHDLTAIAHDHKNIARNQKTIASLKPLAKVGRKRLAAVKTFAEAGAAATRLSDGPAFERRVDNFLDREPRPSDMEIAIALFSEFPGREGSTVEGLRRRIQRYRTTKKS